MKHEFRPRSVNRDTAIRPGFDVLLAVTGARQAASPTARLVAARSKAAQGTGRFAATRFADQTLVTVQQRESQAREIEEMKSPFTRAFQPMVKHDDVNSSGNADHRVGDGPEME
jgi:hypothetical protein